MMITQKNKNSKNKNERKRVINRDNSQEISINTNSSPITQKSLPNTSKDVTTSLFNDLSHHGISNMMITQKNKNSKNKNERKRDFSQSFTNKLGIKREKTKRKPQAMYYAMTNTPAWALVSPGVCSKFITNGADYDIAKAHLPVCLQKRAKKFYSGYNHFSKRSEFEEQLRKRAQSAGQIEKQIFDNYATGQISRSDALKMARQSGHPYTDLIIKQLIRKMTNYEKGDRLGVIGRPAKTICGYLRCGQFQQIISIICTSQGFVGLAILFNQRTRGWSQRKPLIDVLRSLLRVWKVPAGVWAADEAAALFFVYLIDQLVHSYVDNYCLFEQFEKKVTCQKRINTLPLIRTWKMEDNTEKNPLKKDHCGIYRGLEPPPEANNRNFLIEKTEKTENQTNGGGGYMRHIGFFVSKIAKMIGSQHITEKHETKEPAKSGQTNSKI